MIQSQMSALRSITFAYRAREDRVLAAVNLGQAEAWSCWLTRRLSPDSNPIEISDLPKERDEEKRNTIRKLLAEEEAKDVPASPKEWRGSSKQT